MKTSLNIGIFTDAFTPQINGLTTSLQLFIGEFIRQGHNVFIFAPNDRFSYSHEEGSNVWRFPSVLVFGKQFRLALPLMRIKKIEDLHLDVIHTHTPGPIGALGLMAGKRLKTPLVHTYHTFLPQYIHYAHLPKYLGESFVPWLISVFQNWHNLIITPSEGMKNSIIKSAKKPIMIIPTGVDATGAQTLADKIDPWDTLSRYGLKPSVPLVITASRLGKEKDIGFLINTFAKIKERHADCKFLIAGDGPAKNALTEIARKLGLEKDVIFLGFLSQAELFAVYRICRAFIFASRTETQGLAGLEAMAVGLPVVGVSGTGTDDLLAGDQGGFLIKDGPEQFFEKTSVLIADEVLWHQKSQEAFLRAEEFSIGKMADLMISSYRKIMRE